MGCPGQASEHDSNHGEAYESGDGSRVALEIARQAAVASDPGERPLLCLSGLFGGQEARLP